MRFLALFLLLALAALPATAQDDKSFIEGKLQELLSDAGREVTVTGFAGALSSQATLERMTIADDDGVWLTLSDARLNWTRSALLSGHLDIAELSAKTIEITRLPGTGSGSELSPADAQATAFSLPELPISVDIGQIRAEAITLGPDILGEPVTLSLEGGVELAGGEGAARLDISRTGRSDRLSMTGAFSNTSRVLALDLDFREDRDGMVARLLGIPGAPALRLQVDGEAPISDYAARIALTSDGARRMGGAVTIAALPDPVSGGDAPDNAISYGFTADLSGDVRPLFPTDMHPFFGESSSLNAQGVSHADGRLTLERLTLDTGAMQVAGDMALSAAGWPEHFRLDGQIGEGNALRLPLPGAETTVESATIAASYDATQGEHWATRMSLTGFARDGLRIGRADLTGTGRILRQGAGAVTGDLNFITAGLNHAEGALAAAVGPGPAGSAVFRWAPDAPLVFERLTLDSGDLNLSASGEIDQLADGLPVRGRVTWQSGDITRFAGLAGRPLAGAARAQMEGEGTLLGGAFDILARADTDGLRVGEPRLDPLLADPARLVIKARRDTTGTTLDHLTVDSDSLTARASGRLDARSGQLDLTAALAEIALIEPRLSGPADFTAGLAWQAGGALSLDRMTLNAAGATLTGTGTLHPEDPALPAAGEIRLIAPDLSRLARIAGRPLAGDITLDLSGSGELQGQAADLSFDLTGANLRTGLAELDRLIAGAVSASGAVALGDGPPDLRYLELASPRLKANASGTGPGAPIAVSLRLSDLGLLAPGFDGPAAARGTATLRDRLGQRADIALDATGPGAIAARITGAVNDYGQSLSLSLDGTTQLGIANRFIAPRSLQGTAGFALRVDGPPQLASLSGRVTVEGASASLPTLTFALRDLGGTVDLTNGRALIDIGGSAGTGGSFRVEGPISLSSPYPAELSVRLDQLGLFDPSLYQTTVGGDLSVSGPLLGGAVVGGTLTLGPTELRVPSGSGVIVGTLPDINHIGEPAAVNRTRVRAGLTGQAETAATRPFPLNLTVNAPNRIFVRGRGLDAELGGSVRLTGSTDNVQASGQFELIRGRLDILGKRLVLTEGLIDLRGALDPYLRFVAEAQADDVLVLVVLEGLASEPNVTFSSQPDLPQEEVVARLLFGRDLASMSAFQAAQLVSAVATLSGRYSGGFSGRLRNSLGLSDLDITTTQDGATQLKAGAYVSENIYSEVVADSEGNQEIHLNLDITDTVTVKGRAGNDGNTGIGIYFEKDY